MSDQFDTPESGGESREVLLVRQRALQAEASDVLADLDLLVVVGTIGGPVVTGSLALGLMVWRDIDVTTLCPTLDPASVFEVARPLARHPRVRRVTFRDDTGAWNTDPDYPDGVYLGLDYRSPGGHDWRLDLWFLLDGTTQFDLEDVVALPPRLTPEARLAILRIKDAWHRRPEYGSTVRSADVYAAVLNHGIDTPEAFERYLETRARRS